MPCGFRTVIWSPDDRRPGGMPISSRRLLVLELEASREAHRNGTMRRSTSGTPSHIQIWTKSIRLASPPCGGEY